MVSFWFFLWRLLLPVLVNVVFLIYFLLFYRNSFFITGIEYIIVELFLVIIPIFILAAIVKDSLNLLYLSSQRVGADLILKVIASQWYWNYEIRDIEELRFTRYIKIGDDLIISEKRFLEVDNRLVLPISLNIQANITSRDVIHRFSVPTLALKTDATAGILNVLNFNIRKVGIHSGICSEICGINHRYIPIVVEGTLFSSFYHWVLLFL